MLKTSPGVCGRTRVLAGTVLFLLALYLRTAGLSHDLHEGWVYHPDTPKQIRATELFLDGEYYVIIGGRDYEGYPYFNSHVAEYLVRIYEGVRHQVRAHLGLPHSDGRPDTIALFLLVRGQNAVMSSLAVLLVYVIGLRLWSLRAGIVAGLLLALSPADVTAAHFAAGDTAAAFFALCAVFCALFLSRSRRFIPYVLGGVFTAAAFSSKYHGGIALLALGVAHLSLYPPFAPLLTKASILPGITLIVSFLIGVFLTSPALLVYPESAFKDILAFIEYTSTFGMTPEMVAMSWPERFMVGMSINMPVLWDVLGPVVSVAGIVALFLLAKHWSTWIIAIVPIAYIIAGLATKPLTHPVYHTMATPYLMLLAAGTLERMLGLTSRSAIKFAWLPKAALAAALIVNVVYLAAYTQRELFFFRHNDTRFLAQNWLDDHHVPQLNVQVAPYTVRAVPESLADGASLGDLFIYSDRVPIRPPQSAFHLTTLELEGDKLSVFRNWDQYLFIDAPDLWRSDFLRPGFQPLSAGRDVSMLIADAPWLARHPGSWNVRAPMRHRGSLQSREALTSAVWLVRTEQEAATLDLRLGRDQQRITLPPYSAQLIEVKKPRARRIARAEHNFYAWSIHARRGTATTHLLTDPRDIAWAYFNTGYYGEAAHRLAALGADELEHVDHSAWQLSRWMSEPQDKAPYLSITASASDPLQRYGLADELLDELPGYVAQLITNKVEQSALHRPRDTDTQPPRPYYEVSLGALEPGHYRVLIERDLMLGQEETDPLEALLLLPHHVLAAAPFSPYQSHLELNFGLGYDGDAPVIQLHGTAQCLASIRHVELRPQLVATQDEFQALAQALQENRFDEFTASALSYPFLVEAGQRLATNQEWSAALAAFRTAIEDVPWRTEAYTALARARDQHTSLSEEVETQIVELLAPYIATAHQRALIPVDVTFRNGARLTGYQLKQERLQPGDHFGLHLHWADFAMSRNHHREHGWIHLVPVNHEGETLHGRESMQSWHMRNQLSNQLIPPFSTIELPDTMAPGQYDVKVGIWIPAQRRPVRIRASEELPYDRRGVFLTTIDVTAP